MSKEEISDASSGIEETWTFPDLDGPAAPADGFHLLMESEEESSASTPAVADIVEETEEERLRKELTLEKEKLTSEFSAKINLVGQIADKLHQPLSIIDDEITDLMISMIKKISKKLILKEIEVDKKIMIDLIEDLKNYIPHQTPVISIHVSEHDWQYVVLDDRLKNIVTSSPSLNSGDVIVKSNFTEVRALIDDRIDQILRGSNE